MTFYLLQRIQIADDIATIRFTGELPQWSSTIALGIEWDEPSRGKNNGTIEGVTYFTPTVPGSCSFIKLTNKKIKHGITFTESLLAEYYNEEENAFNQVITFGNKTVQPFGFEKLNRIQSNFLNLTLVSLNKKSISSIDGEIHGLDNVRNLDLSYNLFGMKMIIQLIPRLPNLKVLNLNGNRLGMIPELLSISHLTTLKLCDTKLDINLINKIIKMLPQLSTLQLSLNGYFDQEVQHLELESITSLDLSFNNLTTVPNLPIQTLILSDNKIVSMSGIIPTVNTLDIRYNSISEWTMIDKVSLVFPQLGILKCAENPVFDQVPLDLMSILVIARVPNLSTLNGSKLKPDEITNAELYFISQVQQQKLDYDKRLPHWKSLLLKYNKEEIVIGTKRSNKIMLHLKWADQVSSRIFLLNNSLLRLKGIISKWTGIPFLQLKLYYYINEFEDSEFRMKLYLCDNTAMLDQFGFQAGQTIFVDPT